jgi:hypothetical protein
MGSPIHQIMDLQQVDIVRLEQSERVLDLGLALGAAVAPDLGSELKVLPATLGREADDAFALAVHRRGVDERHPRREAALDDPAPHGDVAFGADVEGSGGSQADDRHLQTAERATFHPVLQLSVHTPRQQHPNDLIGQALRLCLDLIFGER